MITEVNPTTVNHKVGECPACRDLLWAEVDLIARVEDPRMVDGKPNVYATAIAIGARINHECTEVTS